MLKPFSRSLNVVEDTLEIKKIGFILASSDYFFKYFFKIKNYNLISYENNNYFIINRIGNYFILYFIVQKYISVQKV